MDPKGEHYYLAVEHGLVQAALNALNEAGVDYSIRKGPIRDEDLPDGGEIDLSIQRSNIARTREVLEEAGFHYLKAPGHPNHHFILGFAAGVWLKVDVKTQTSNARGSAAYRRLAGTLARRRPIGLGRRGPVVALLGPDGAGKGTVVAALTRRIPMAVVVVYMGGPRKKAKGEQADLVAKSPSAAREVAFILRRLLRSWSLLWRAYAAAWRGHIVLCDRHPIEVLAVRPQRSRFGTRLERALFARLVPRPDRIVVLDAPAEVLLARKKEHSVEKLERWRRDYAEEFIPYGATLVSSAGSMSQTVAAVSTVVWEQLNIRRRW